MITVVFWVIVDVCWDGGRRHGLPRQLCKKIHLISSTTLSIEDPPWQKKVQKNRKLVNIKW